MKLFFLKISLWISMETFWSQVSNKIHVDHNFFLFLKRYVDMHTDYSGQGVDQLKIVIDTIKKDPNNRRIIMSAWNPAGGYFYK